MYIFIRVCVMPVYRCVMHLYVDPCHAPSVAYMWVCDVGIQASVYRHIDMVEHSLCLNIAIIRA